MFEKKVTIFKKKDRAQWQKIRDVLKASGLKGVRATHYLQDSVMAGGCGAKLDPRDFGPGGKVDHDIYVIRVREDDQTKALEILRENGLVAEVQTDLMTDAALRQHDI